MEQVPHDLVLLQQHGHRLRLVDPGLATVAVGILAEGALQVLGDADVVNDQTGGIVSEDPVHPGDGLHQPVALHGLVDVHGVHAGRVEARQPHVAHDHQLQRIPGVPRPFGQQVTSGLGAPGALPGAPQMRLPVRGIGG